MTAITGLVGAQPTSAQERACRASLHALHIYGARQSLRSAKGASFGVRLAQLLPEDRFDRQPYLDERFMFVADVRLDNRTELIVALNLHSDESSVLSDSELLFQAWRRWQYDCVDKIVGDYAFAVLDRESGSLVLARDPIGQRPLFFARIADTIAFSSMPSGILPHGRFEHDRIRIAQRLAGQENESRRSYFRGVTRVLSGEMLIISGDALRSSRWDPRTDELIGRPTNSLVTELRHTLDLAVAARLRRNSGTIATHLSSGYDSSAVTATAAMLHDRKDIVAFTAAPALGRARAALRNRNADESAIAERTARQLGIKHDVVRVSEPLLDSLRDHTRYFQEPVRNPLNMGWFAEIERRAARRGANVLLVGEVGNLSLSAGGLTILAEWVRKGAWARWAFEGMAAARRPDVRWRGVLMSTFQYYLPNWLNEQLIRIFHGQPRWSSACFVRPEVLRELPQTAVMHPGRPAAERLEILRGFDAGVFRKGSLAKHGVDERDPTGDRRLIEFSLRLPPEQLLDRGVYKPLARAALADRVPGFVLDLPLRGYQSADWVSRIDRASALTVYEEICADSTVQLVIDLPRLKRTISAWPDPGETGAGEIEAFGRHVTNALAMGVFVIESANQESMGR